MLSGLTRVILIKQWSALHEAFLESADNVLGYEESYHPV